MTSRAIRQDYIRLVVMPKVWAKPRTPRLILDMFAHICSQKSRSCCCQVLPDDGCYPFIGTGALDVFCCKRGDFTTPSSTSLR